MKEKFDLEAIAEQVIEESARRAVRNVLARNWGYGIEDGVKKVILEKAQEIIDTDPELQKMIRDTLIYWIRRQE